jgi:hypothetical protein
MNRRVRRGAVILGVVASLTFGVVAIQVAAQLTAAAAPPPAPPISMSTLKGQLADEQARAASLQQQLEDLLGVTSQLTAALDGTEDQVADDGLSAAQLRDRLRAAEAKLNAVNQLLKKAQARLAALDQAIDAGSGTTPPAGGGSGGGNPPPPATTPAPPPPSTFSLSLSLAGGDVRAAWTTCSSSGFYAYALVRSTDSEIHYPPEDRDTLVAQVSSVGTTAAADTSAPSGRLWYRVYCLTRSGGETRVSKSTPTVQITAP